MTMNFFQLSFALHILTGTVLCTARNDNSSCPSWFIYNDTSSKCLCGHSLGGMIKCRDDNEGKEISVMDCYCMTYDQELGMTVAGACFYNCEHSDNLYSLDPLYHRMPLNTSVLNEAMCGDRFFRAGRLCGECKAGYHPFAYSYELKCTDSCSGKSDVRNWIVYVAVAFVPVTVFYLFILVFRINAASPALAAYVFVAQTLSAPILIRLTLVATTDHRGALSFVKGLVTLYGVWNLDFFRTLYPPFCLKLDTLQTLALDCAIAVYPLVLIILTYVVIQLYARGYLILVVLWMPFKECYSRFHSVVDPRTSIIDVFVSFLVLSYVKLLYITMDLLLPTVVYDAEGNEIGLYLYYDANVKFFGWRHLPYGILAIFLVLIFILFPVLVLLLYPLKITQKYVGSWQVLRIFTDSFQGCYKDGVTEGKYDLRYFSTVYLIARIVLFSAYSITLNGFFFPLLTLLTSLLIVVLAMVKPYKKKFQVNGKIEIALLMVLNMWFASCVCGMIAEMKAPKYIPLSFVLIGLFGLLPLFYIPALLLYMLWQWKLYRQLLQRINNKRQTISLCSCHAQAPVSRDSLEQMKWLLEHSYGRYT